MSNRQRDRILRDFQQAFRSSGERYSVLARKSGITPATLSRWDRGLVRSPLISTMRMALDRLGYEIVVSPKRDKS